MPDWMGAVGVALELMVDIIKADVLAALRVNVDGTRVPDQAKGKTKSGRLWIAVRNDRPSTVPIGRPAAFMSSSLTAAAFIPRHS